MFHAFCHIKFQQTVLSAKHEGVGDKFKIQALQVARGIILWFNKLFLLICHVIYVMTFWPCECECECECDCPATKKHEGYRLKILGP
jgi:hypothetical protein